MKAAERDQIAELARIVAPAWTEAQPATLAIVELGNPEVLTSDLRTYWLPCDIRRLPTGPILWNDPPPGAPMFPKL